MAMFCWSYQTLFSHVSKKARTNVRLNFYLELNPLIDPWCLTLDLPLTRALSICPSDMVRPVVDGLPRMAGLIFCTVTRRRSPFEPTPGRNLAPASVSSPPAKWPSSEEPSLEVNPEGEDGGTEAISSRAEMIDSARSFFVRCSTSSERPAAE